MILKAISALLHSPQKFSKKFTDVEIHLTQFCFSQFFRSFQIQTPNTNCKKFRVQLTICILQLSKKGLGLIVPFFKKTSTCQSSKNRRDRHDDVCISDICVCVLYLHVFCNGCIPSHFLCRNISFNRLHYYRVSQQVWDTLTKVCKRSELRLQKNCILLQKIAF